MTVYVDDMRAPYGRMIMCHMWSPDVDELHKMADQIGINRKWFQDKPGFPHYDISLGKRKLAISKGAVEIGMRELVEKVRASS